MLRCLPGFADFNRDVWNFRVRDIPTPVQSQTAVSLRELVAANMTRLRTGGQVAIESVARSAQLLGLPWTSTWVSSVEHGTRALNAEQLIALPVVLSMALGYRVSLTDLINGDRPVALATGQDPLPAGYVRDIVTGTPYHRPFTAVAADATALLMASNAAVVEKMRQVREANLGDVDVRALGRAEAGAGAAESRLAKRLGIPEIIVIAASASLWGRSLSDERDARLRDAAGSATTVNRQLTTAVIERIERARNSP